MLDGHDGAVWDATVLSDGRILSMSEDTHRLWARDGTPLGVVDEQEAFEIYNENIRASDQSQPKIIWPCNGNVLAGYNTEINAPVCWFISDSELWQSAITQSADGAVAAGGIAGKLHVLHPNAALRQLMGVANTLEHEA